MDLERKTIVIPAHDHVRDDPCNPPCDGAYGIRAEIWTFALVNVELQVGFALEVYTKRYLPITPPFASSLTPTLSVSWHHGFPLNLEMLSMYLDAEPARTDCGVLDGACWSSESYFRLGESLGAFVDFERVEQPERLWAEMERMARPEIDRLLTKKAIYEQHERCPHCAGAGYSKKR